MTATPYPRPVYAWFCVVVLLYANLASYMARIAIALVVQPIKHDLDISDTSISLLQGLSFTLFFVLAGLPCGWLVDRVNRRNLLIPATLLWCAMAVFGGLAASFGSLFIARIFLGVGEAALIPAGYSMIADCFPASRRGKPIGMFMGAGALGVGFGTIGGGLILKALIADPGFTLPLFGPLAPWRALFCLTAVPGVLAAVLLLMLAEPARQSAPPRHAPAIDAPAKPAGLIHFLRHHGRPLAPVYAGSALTMIAFYALVAWSVTLFVRRYHLNIATASLIVGITNTLVGFLAISGGGMWGDRLAAGGRPGGRLRVAVPALAAAAPGIVLLCLAPPTMPALAVVGLVIASGGIYMSGGAFYPSIQDIAPNEQRGIALAILLLCNNLVGATLGPMLVALTTDHILADPNRLGLSLLMIVVPSLVCGVLIVRSGFATFSRGAAAR